MSDKLIVFNQDYPIIVFVLALVLLTGLVAREWIRENKRRKIVRCIVAVLLGLSLMAIIFEPALRRSLDKSNLVLLTPGYAQSQRDSLRRAVPKADFRIKDSTTNAYRNLDNFGAIYILGEGIPEYDLWRFEGRPAKFLGNEQLSGLTRINFPKTAEKERKLTIKGEFLTDQVNQKLYLEGAEGRLDSAEVGAEQSLFELSFVPKTVGNFIYTISDEAGNLSEKVPLTIQPSQQLKVLMINAFPTFETRYLKNYLARRGNEVTVRNQVSKGVYRTEFYNTPQIPINRLTSQLLSAQDVIIFDLQSLEALNRAERSLLNDAIQDEGVGMFIQPEGAIFKVSTWLSIQGIPTEDEIVSGNIAGTAVTLARYSFQLRKSDFQISLLEDDENLFALAERKGLGKVGTTMLKDTYRQNLTGDSLVYANIWSEILNGLAKQNPASTTLMAQNKVTYAFEPYNFELQNPLGHRSLGEGDLSHRSPSEGDQSPNVLITQFPNPQSSNLPISNYKIPLQQNPDIPERWSGTFWSRTPGWQEMVVASDTIPFYIHEQGQWQERRAYDRVATNQAFFSEQAAQNTSELFQHKAVPVLWFYGLFLLSAGWLWLEPKV